MEETHGRPIVVLVIRKDMLGHHVSADKTW